VDEIDNFLDKTKKKTSKLEKIITLLQNHADLKDSFRYNEFTGKEEVNRDMLVFSPHSRPGDTVSDQDITLLRAFLAKKLSWDSSEGTIACAVTDVATRHSYHPIKQYLKALKWDGVERLDHWLFNYCYVEETPFTMAVARKILVAMVKRIFEPGCQFDHMPILEGEQGIYKSSLLRALGEPWYGTIVLTTDRKSMVENMVGKWLLEVEELVGFRKGDQDHIKSNVSCPMDTVRLSYGRKSHDYKRQSVFVATYNPGEYNKYLSDNQNRRFWPITIPPGVKIKLEEFKEVRDLLLAEAQHLYLKGEKLFLDDEASAFYSQLEQREREVPHPLEDKIVSWLEDKSIKNVNFGVTTTEIAIDCCEIPKGQLNSGHHRDIAKVLKKDGWAKKPKAQGKERSVYRKIREANEEDGWDT